MEASSDPPWLRSRPGLNHVMTTPSSPADCRPPDEGGREPFLSLNFRPVILTPEAGMRRIPARRQSRSTPHCLFPSPETSPNFMGEEICSISPEKLSSRGEAVDKIPFWN